MKERRKTKEQLVLDYIRETVEKIPSDAEKEEIIKNLNMITRHIQDLGERVKLLPNEYSKKEILSAIDLIDRFLLSARDNPTMAAALSLPYQRAMSRKLSKKEVLPQVGQQIFEELKTIPTEEILHRLLDYKTTSMGDLRALARHLGIKHQERVKRQDLIDKIVKLGFANVRGYERLREGNNNQSTYRLESDNE